jgi:hypothetical protein
MKEHGLIERYADFFDLPVQVVEDARLLMASEARQRKRDAESSEVRRRRR